MLGIVLTFKVQEGKGLEFESIFSEMAAQVRANETGNFFYQFTRSRAEPNTYKVLEVFRDDAALAEHGKYEHTRTLAPKFMPLLSAPPHIDMLDTLNPQPVLG